MISHSGKTFHSVHNCCRKQVIKKREREKGREGGEKLGQDGSGGRKKRMKAQNEKGKKEETEKHVALILSASLFFRDGLSVRRSVDGDITTLSFSRKKNFPPRVRKRHLWAQKGKNRKPSTES